MSDTPKRPTPFVFNDNPIEDPDYDMDEIYYKHPEVSAYMTAMEAENAALRESAKAAEHKGMERALEIVHNLPDYEMYRLSVEAAIRAAMEE